MAEMRHPHVVQFLGLCYLEGSVLPVLVMERLDSSLDDLLETSHLFDHITLNTQLRFGTPSTRPLWLTGESFALRMCMRDWNTNYATLLQSSNLPTLASRRRYLKLCFLYQVIQGQLTTCCLEKPASKFEKQQYLSTSEACYLFYCTSVLLFSPHYRLMELPPPLQCIVVTLCTFFKRSLLQLNYA